MKWFWESIYGNSKISPDKELVAFWRTVKEHRFQNYEAYFTILNTGDIPISKEWIKKLIYDHEVSHCCIVVLMKMKN